MQKDYYIIFFCLCLALSFIVEVKGQVIPKTPTKPLKNWNSMALSVKVLPRVNLSYSQLFGFNTQPYKLSFIQNGFGANFYVKRHISVGLGHSNTFIFKREDTDIKYRFYVSTALRNRIGKLNLSNAFMGEYHSVNETKYRWRIIYTIRAKPPSIKLNKFLKLSPFISYRIYYNIGGNPVRQFINNGKDYIGKHVPYGLHRMRLAIGTSLKTKMGWSFSLQLMRQQEFNTDFSHRHAMNVYNQDRDRIERPFSNYFMLGGGIRYYWKLKSVKKVEKRLEKRNKTQKPSPNRFWQNSPISQGN